MPRVRTALSSLAAVLALVLLALLAAGPATAAAARVTVAPGDTLGAIAARNGVSVAALARANGIENPDRVRAGARLVVPGSGARSATAPAAAAGTVRVRPGDTLAAIAARHGTSARAIAAANGIPDPDVVAAGRVLRLPGASAASPSAAGGGPASRSYRIRAGDTLGAIAARHGLSVRALAALNGIRDPSAIAAGAVLTLPGTRPAAATATPTSSAEVASLIARHAPRYGVDPALARAIAWQESGWTQSAVSSTGAIGVMQLMPDTARWLGRDIIGRPLDPRVLEDNIEGGIAYLGWLNRHGGTRRRAVGGYYQGLASLRERGPYDDTKSYVANVLALIGRV